MHIYRWHISRKFVDAPPEGLGDQRVDVTITPRAEALLMSMPEATPLAMLGFHREDLGWWQIGEEHELEGSISEADLITVLAERNLDPEAGNLADPQQRRIVEDMVLIQFVEDEESFEGLWSALRAEQGWPDVTDLAANIGAKWIDYTLRSRREVKQIYISLLGEAEQQERDVYASE
jgi:hypothetical protein